jgi:hypothetical protein
MSHITIIMSHIIIIMDEVTNDRIC